MEDDSMTLLPVSQNLRSPDASEDQGQLLKKHVAQPAPVEEPQDAGTKGQEEELSSKPVPHSF